MTEPWWRHHFDDDYFDLNDPFFDEERSRREVAGMRELLALPWGARILDAPCGWGRHTPLLAAAGLQATGADLSFALLERAPRTVADDDAAADDDAPADENAPADDDAASHDDAPPDRADPERALANAPVPPVYAAADIRALPFADASFDAVVNVYTSLGLFLNDADDIAALREARRVLRPDGRLLLESMHRDDVIAHYADRDGWTLPDGTAIRVRRSFDPVSGISHERLQWRRGDRSGRRQHSLRLRTATEIDHLLRTAGFTAVQYYADWDASPFHHRAESLIAIATP